MVHCATNNLDKNESETIADAIIKIGNIFQEKSVAKIILAGLLLQCLNKYKQGNKTFKVNYYLKKFCKDKINRLYLEQDSNCVHKDQSINTSLCSKDY